ncbi:MAG: hypothetical protein AUG51_06020 [Acidobacteria bacterium 13_1_20CM_3_53_8]|nr:MAG: hypothetical protein AUG51_06020 [Acidobacteria bacterium 13_1_20CM_3_53_8]
MQTLWQDLRYGFRTLLQRPGFTAVAALTLALGIGANTAIFSVINGVLLRSLPFQDPNRIVTLWEANKSSRQIHVSNPNLMDWREQNHSFESFSAYSGRWGGKMTILGGNEPERAYAVAVYQDFFKVLGVQPLMGRTFSPDEHKPGALPVAVVSYGFWQRRLGGDADLSNKKLSLEGISFNVIGVMPQWFDFPSDTDLWLAKEQFGPDTSARSAHNFIGIARLKPGITLEQAQADMNAVALNLEQQYPEDNRGQGVAVISLQDSMVGSIRPALLILFAAVSLVLLIACANVSNLLLARSISRQKEIAIRTALGASHWRIVRQLLTESALLSLIGGALGLLLADWLVGVLVALSPGTIPRVSEIRIDNRTFLFTLGISLVTSLIFGLVPALRFSKPDLQDTLKQGGQTPMSSSGFLRSALVISEVALTLVLLIGAGLLTKSFWRVLEVNPGFNPEHVLTMQIALPESEFHEDSERVAFYRQLFTRIENLSGVESAGMINNLPMGGVNINGQFQIEGDAEWRGSAGFRIVSPNYFRAMGITLLRGRAFTDEDTENSPAVAVISERVANSYWPGEDPIGRRIRSGMDATSRNDTLINRWMTVVGVVGDVRHSGLEQNASAELYVPYTQRPRRASDMSVVMRTNDVDPSGIVAAARNEVRAINKNLPVEFEPMQQVFSRSVANRRYNMILLGAFASLALILSVMGLYGVMSYTVTQSTREIGIRMALGAQASDILKIVVGHGLALTLIGVGLGITGAFALTRLMTGLLYQVQATDPVTFVFVSVMLVVVAMLACYIPARRATKVDPMVALRYE